MQVSFNKREIFILCTIAFLFGVLIYKVNPLFATFVLPFLLLKQTRLIPFFALLGIVAFGIREQSLKLPVIEKMEEATAIGKVEKIYFKENGIRAVIKTQNHSKLIVSFKKQEAIKIGDILEIEGLLIPLPKKVYPTFYDVEMKNRFLGISGYISVRHYKVIKKEFSLLEQARSYTLKTLASFQNQNYKGVAIALLLGDKGGINPEVYMQFKTAGLAHILAISGLHMSITIILFFGIFWKLLSLTPACLICNTKRISAIIGMFFGLFYLSLSSFPVSGVRSFIMVSLLFSSFIFERGASGIRALCIALIIILLLWPEEVLFPSFQLSFSAVLCLLYCYNFRFKINGYKGKILNSSLSILFSSFLITLSSIPFVVHHFNFVHFYGALFNVVAIPFLAIIVMPLAMFNILTAGLITPAFEWSIGVLFSISKISLHLPFNSVFMPYFNGYLLSVYAFGLIFLLCFKSKVIKILGVVTILGSLIFYAVTAKMPQIVVNEDFLVIRQGKDYISVFKIPEGFLKQIWSQNLNSPLPLYKDVKNLDFTCKYGVCTSKSFTIIYNDNYPENIKCNGDIFLNMYSDFIPLGCSTKKIILKSDLAKQNPTPILIY